MDAGLTSAYIMVSMTNAAEMATNAHKQVEGVRLQTLMLEIGDQDPSLTAVSTVLSRFDFGQTATSLEVTDFTVHGSQSPLFYVNTVPHKTTA